MSPEEVEDSLSGKIGKVGEVRGRRADSEWNGIRLHRCKAVGKSESRAFVRSSLDLAEVENDAPASRSIQLLGG
jgi:hypothetical protein